MTFDIFVCDIWSSFKNTVVIKTETPVKTGEFDFKSGVLKIEEVLKEYGINKIRLHRNFGRIKFYKKIVKNLFNKKLRKRGFITTDKMGSFEDLRSDSAATKSALCEIMVHPDFDKNGVLVDRTDWSETIAVGTPLDTIYGYIVGLTLISYKDLQ